MPRCAFLTLEDPTGFVIDDELAYPAFAALGWQVDAVPWSRPRVNWTDYDVVVIRSTWDYMNQVGAFLERLEEIEKTGVPLFNPLPLVRWNLQKTYLRDLADRGIDVVPTIWRDRLVADELVRLIEQIGTEEFVLKPVVGANASGAYRLTQQSAHDRVEELTGYFAGRALMAQPFLSSVVREGEYSLFYFNGQYSHTILKTPKTNDFRVQEEHGGLIRAVPSDPALSEAGAAVMRAIGETPLYARADFVREDD